MLLPWEYRTSCEFPETSVVAVLAWCISPAVLVFASLRVARESSSAEVAGFELGE
jgi:hypothetical protein